MGKVKKKTQELNELPVAPGGFKPQENIHLLKKGSHIKVRKGKIFEIETENKKIIKEFGKADPEKINNFENKLLIRSKKITLQQDLLGLPISNRWIIYSGWMNKSGAPITYFRTRWKVPPHPSTNNGQVIFLFNGIQNKSSSYILQPVLQWGKSNAGGGNFWAITNWFVTQGDKGSAIFKELAAVNPGDIIEGIMVLTKNKGSKFSYKSSFKDFPQCDLEIEGIDELCWANETLECYDLYKFSDYPNTNVTEMTDIEIRTGNQQVSLKWDIHNDVTDNGQHCIIKSNSSTNGAVSLYYKNELFA